MLTVALVGADGAGKTTVALEVLRQINVPSRYLYMGVNLEASRLMLPTTRLLVELKRLNGRPPDLAPPGHDISGVGDAARRTEKSTVRTTLRYVNQIAEEWFRQLVAWYYVRQGKVVIFDRHFMWDYYASSIAPKDRGVPTMRRVHDLLLFRLYPRPDLVICLDAPGDVLFSRKGGGTVEEREHRRQEYLEHGANTPGFIVIDVTQPMHAVVQAVTLAISRARDERTNLRPVGS